MDTLKVSMNVWDIIVVVVYFLFVIGTGLFSMWRTNRSTINGYFLAGRFVTWLPVGASLFASNIGSEHFIGLAGSGAASGIGVGAFEFNALLLLQLLGWVFLPVYIASGVCTLPEYMHKRFGGSRIQVYLAVLSLILYIFTKISVNLYSGYVFIQEFLGWNIYISILILLTMSAIVTVTGGLAAVIYTDTLQCFVMIIGAIMLAIISFVKVGGYNGLLSSYGSALANSTLYSNSSCGLTKSNSFRMLRNIDDSDMPWLGFLLGQTPASIWYWCADQMMVQRALASKSLSHAQGATLFAGILKILPLFVIVMPGMVSRVLYPESVGCSDPDICMQVCGSRAGCSNIAYPKLVMGLLPTGLRGIMLAVVLSALISDLTSVFNSASTLFTMDIYTRIRKQAAIRELMIVGRLFVIIMVIASILWVPIIQQFQGAQLFIYIQIISGYLAPPIATIYMLAIMWPRANEIGSFWALIWGFSIGAARLIVNFAWPDPLCHEEDWRPELVRWLPHYMYFAMFSSGSTLLLAVLISLLTEKPDIILLRKTTFWTRMCAAEDEGTALESTQTLTERCTLKEMAAVVSLEKDDDVAVLNVKDRSFLLRLVLWFCGMNSTTTQDMSHQSEHLKQLRHLKQSPTTRHLLNVALLLLLLLAVTLYVYFSVAPLSIDPDDLRRQLRLERNISVL